MVENRIFAYCRVSKNDGTMTIDNQIHTIKKYAEANNITIHEYYQDECKGDTPIDKRKQMPVMLNHLRSGDTVIVVEVSRLHRSARGLESVYRIITEDKQAEFITLDEKEQILCTVGTDRDDLLQTSMKRIVLTVMATLSEIEKKNISARTKRSLSERKARGIKLGRPTVEAPANFKAVYESACHGEISHVQAMKQLGLKKTSYYKIAKSFES